MPSKALFLSKLATDIDANGNLTADGVVGGELGGSVTVYDSIGLLPYQGNQIGDEAFVNSNNRLYLWQGSGWYNIALINQAPSILSVQDSDGGTTPFELSSEGNVTTITITATDSDGDPITFSATADSDFNGLATISQDASVFTVTPLSEDSATTTSGTVTFTATDGINISTDINTFTLSFAPNWTAVSQQAKIQADDGAETDFFGRSVAIDGDTAIVGAWQHDPSGVTNVGAAYIFTRSGSTWTQQAKLTPSDGVSQDMFGYSVAIEGDTVVVGSRDHHTSNVINSGAAYIFTRSGSTWTEQAKLGASDPAVSGFFGYGVAIEGDTVVVSAWRQDNELGAVYVFVTSDGGSTWTQQAKLRSSDIGSGDRFGSAIGISGDTIGVGAYLHDPSGLSNAGAAYIFTRSGSTWTQQAKLTASDAEADDNFGFGGLGISGDTVVIGAIEESTTATDAGAAYIFTRSGSTWTQQAKIQANDAAADDNFGESIDIGDGVIVVTARNADPSGLSGAGAAYVFTGSGSTWTQQAKLTASDAEASDRFGETIRIDEETIIVGASGESSNVGAAYIFTA